MTFRVPRSVGLGLPYPKDFENCLGLEGAYLRTGLMNRDCERPLLSHNVRTQLEGNIYDSENGPNQTLNMPAP